MDDFLDIDSLDDISDDGLPAGDTGFTPEINIDMDGNTHVDIEVSSTPMIPEISFEGTSRLSAAENGTLFDISAKLNNFSDNHERTLLGRWAGEMADYLTKESSAEMSEIREAVDNSADFFNTHAPHLYHADSSAHFRWNGSGDYMIGGNPQLLEMIGIGGQDSIEFAFAHEFSHYMQHINPIEGISDNSKLNEMTSDFSAAFKSGAEGRSVDEIKTFMQGTGSNSDYPDGEIRSQIIELGHSLGEKYLWRDFHSVSKDPGFSFYRISNILHEFKAIDESLWGQKVAELQAKVDNTSSITFK